MSATDEHGWTRMTADDVRDPSVFSRALPWFRVVIRSMQTQRHNMPAPMKVALGVLLVIVFAPLWASLRVRAIVRGPLRVLAVTESGNRFDCHLPDMIQTYLYLFGQWEPDVAAFIKRRLSEGDGFVDVGANVGCFSLLAADCVGASGSVVAIEAAPRIFDLLAHNVAINNPLCQVRLVERAASDVPGTIDIFAGPVHNVGLTSTRQHRGMRYDVTVEAAPLDHLLTAEELRSARLIKIDVEGGEDAVLAGLAACLDRLRPDAEILVELSPTWWEDRSKTPREVLAPFLEVGFNVYEVPNNYWPWRYLWPTCVERPRRVRADLRRRVSRLDLVLSRVDAETL